MKNKNKLVYGVNARQRSKQQFKTIQIIHCRLN